jgi:hypothetical protein
MARPRLSDLHAKFCAAPFPRLGSVGFFAAYDGFIGGYASRAAKGETIAASLLPEPDEETVRLVRRLYAAPRRSAEESEFLNYFELVEEVRSAISTDAIDIWVPLLDEGTDVYVVAKAQRIGPRRFVITAFDIDLAAQDAKPSFDVGSQVLVSGGHEIWNGGAIVGATRRIAVELASIPA